MYPSDSRNGFPFTMYCPRRNHGNDPKGIVALFLILDLLVAI